VKLEGKLVRLGENPVKSFRVPATQLSQVDGDDVADQASPETATGVVRRPCSWNKRSVTSHAEFNRACT